MRSDLWLIAALALICAALFLYLSLDAQREVNRERQEVPTTRAPG